MEVFKDFFARHAEAFIDAPTTISGEQNLEYYSLFQVNIQGCMYMYIHVYMYVYLSDMSIYVCMHIFISSHVYMYTYLIHIYVYAFMHMYIYIYICVYTYLYTCMESKT
jgi:hypothetical protein